MTGGYRDLARRGEARTAVAIMQSVFDSAIREINALDGRIVATEDDADALLWQQAEHVVAQLDAGLSQRQLAAQWINGRTGEPYGQTHVFTTARVCRDLYTNQPRPRFRDAYNTIANASKAHVAQNTGNNEWYTPADLIEAARTVLGDIDLDPASSEQANETVKAAQFFTRDDDGLMQPWHGRVWMNPPYAQPLVSHFAEKLAASVRVGDVPAAVVLINNATETEWFHTLAAVAAVVCFPKGRVRFWSPDKDSATPLQGQAVLYIGRSVDGFCERFASFGIVARIAAVDHADR